jgi:phosphatidylinositol alpha-1,6-mannosyltransferase
VSTPKREVVPSSVELTLPSRRDLVLVSAGLELDGGGRALAGRLLAGACVRFARTRGIGFRILTLGRDGASPDVEIRSFAGRQAALALAVWRAQAADCRPAYVFDLLGPARVQAWVPASLRSPYLVALHGIEVWRPLSRDRRKTLANAAARLAFSAYTVERARPYCDLDGTAVIPLALEEREPAGVADPGILDRVGRDFLLLVGRMAASERYKGHDQILEALPREARLVIAGEGDDRPRLETRVAEMGLTGRVVFTGFVSEATLAELYRRCAAFVMPSRGEGFGLVYLEAMRAGKPCVAARGGAAEEIVVDGETGFLLDPDDRRELSTVLATLLDRPERARRMGEAGRARWQREFGVERFRNGLEPLLEQLTG